MPRMLCFLGFILAGLNCVVVGFGNEPVDRTNTAGNTQLSSRSLWSIAHGYYGVIGVALLAHCGHVPEISVDDIKDKSNTDGLAKLLLWPLAAYMYLTSRMSSEALASRTGKFRPANPQWRNFAYFEDVGSAEESHDATFPQDTARTGLVGRFRAPPHT
ncbi:hypothetical protein HBH98_099580 [Parastagonospora nodorum]|nr:hypothetical protein HBI10_119920 [Parastagonospora nodorum]KAH4049296.1 hypothetical protein HBH49_144780 [Parastagonospora nodorum]KAH4206309.1 hypothetical protein HBI95_126720 [Parastagonospora nodorum]KAH4346910.1 hypothetical protein HBH98_099580 [Parastagonospora nodorum]KAH4382234.1 hypothetical protein HBH97_082690 [Parastagonospora nodorum]